MVVELSSHPRDADRVFLHQILPPSVGAAEEANHAEQEVGVQQRGDGASIAPSTTVSVDVARSRGKGGARGHGPSTGQVVGVVSWWLVSGDLVLESGAGSRGERKKSGLYTSNGVK